MVLLFSIPVSQSACLNHRTLAIARAIMESIFFDGFSLAMKVIG
jgi:hypothetical protein